MSDPAMRAFSIIEDPDSRRAYFGEVMGEPAKDLAGLARGELVPREPVRIERLEGGRKPRDVIWIGLGQIVVAHRIALLLRGFSGWTPYPVEVYDGRGIIAPGYVGVAILGRCGVVRTERTRVEGSGIWANYVGLTFAVETWDGSDLCYPVAGPGPIVTEPVRHALLNAKIRNAHVTPLTEARTNRDVVDRLIERRRGIYANDIE